VIDPNKLLQMFYCWTCEDTYEPFSKAVLLRFVPLPPADPTAGAPSLLSIASRSVAGFLDANPGLFSRTTAHAHIARTPHTSHTHTHTSSRCARADKDAEVKKNLSLTGLDEKVEGSLAHGALMADVAANEDPAAQLAKRPHDDEARNTENTCFSGHFPLKRLVRWVPRDDWPNADEREDVVEELGQEDDDEEEYDTYYSCKLGGWAPWVQCKCAVCAVWCVRVRVRVR
jgi:hypothetical protein